MRRRQFIIKTGMASVGSVLAGTSFLEKQVNSRVPVSLQLGDTIALSAPAGAVFSTKYIDSFESRLTQKGFKLIKGKSLYAQNGYLAGSDESRAKEINTFFADKAVKAIFTMRGGWGCNRILDLLDYNQISANPKVIMGYSDITSLLLAINKKTGLVTYHGPMGYSSWQSFSTQNVYEILIKGKKVALKNPENEHDQLFTLSGGSSKGELIGGNLTVLTSMIGSEYEPDWTNKILFLEETGEEPYRVDRLLWQLKLAGVYEKINGIVLGSFRKCEPEEPERSFSLDEVFNQHFKGLNKPVFGGASFGHTVNKFTLPIGINAEMDADRFRIQLMQNPTVFNG